MKLLITQTLLFRVPGLEMRIPSTIFQDLGKVVVPTPNESSREIETTHHIVVEKTKGVLYYLDRETRVMEGFSLEADDCSLTVSVIAYYRNGWSYKSDVWDSSYREMNPELVEACRAELSRISGMVIL